MRLWRSTKVEESRPRREFSAGDLVLTSAAAAAASAAAIATALALHTLEISHYSVTVWFFLGRTSREGGLCAWFSGCGRLARVSLAKVLSVPRLPPGSFRREALGAV